MSQWPLYMQHKESSFLHVSPMRWLPDDRLTDAAYRTGMALISFQDGSGIARVKLATLAERRHTSERSAARHLAELRDLGFIQVVQRRRRDGSRGANLYRTLFDVPLEQLGMEVVEGPFDPAAAGEDDDDDAEEVGASNLPSLAGSAPATCHTVAVTTGHGMADATCHTLAGPTKPLLSEPLESEPLIARPSAGAATDAPAALVKAKAKRKGGLPEGWTPGEQGMIYARACGLDADHQLAQFRDRQAAQGATAADWIATWRTWCRNAVTWAAERRSEKLPPLPEWAACTPRPQEVPTLDDAALQAEVRDLLRRLNAILTNRSARERPPIPTWLGDADRLPPLPQRVADLRAWLAQAKEMRIAAESAERAATTERTAAYMRGSAERQAARERAQAAAGEDALARPAGEAGAPRAAPGAMPAAADRPEAAGGPPTRSFASLPQRSQPPLL